MGLQPRSGSGSSSKSLRINASSTDSLMSSGKFSLGSSKEDLGCPSVDPDDPNTVNPFTADRCSTTLSASEAGSPAPPSAPNLNGVGESFFCNVMHLRAHSISSPLAYVTYNVLLKSGLVTVRGRAPSFFSPLPRVFLLFNPFWPPCLLAGPQAPSFAPAAVPCLH